MCYIVNVRTKTTTEYDMRLLVYNAVENRFELRSPYDRELVAAMRNLQGRRWVAADKVNAVAATRDRLDGVMVFCKQHDFNVSDAASKKISDLNSTDEKMARGEIKDRLSGVSWQLYDYQIDGVEHIVNKKRCFIGDEMGTGKTIQAIAGLVVANAFPAVVVCPAAVKLNWKKEIEKGVGEICQVVDGKTVLDLSSKIYIINYDILSKKLKELKSLKPAAVVLDESHYIKNSKSSRSKAAVALGRVCEYRICLSGTPIKNRPIEFARQFDFMGHLGRFGGYVEFGKKYCNGKSTRYGWDFKGSSNSDELNNELNSSFYLRREKKDVLKQLKSKSRHNVYFDIDNRAEYRAAESSIWDFMKEKNPDKPVSRDDRAEALVLISQLKQIAAVGKIAAAKQWVHDVIDNEKLVLFVYHREVLTSIRDEFKCPVIFGGMSATAKQQSIDKFVNNPLCRLICINIKAGGTGIDGLQHAASRCAFLELDWTPADHDQAEDRLHRNGQLNPVDCYYLLANNTIDDDIFALIQKKREIIENVVSGAAGTNDTDPLQELLQLFTKKIK